MTSPPDPVRRWARTSAGAVVSVAMLIALAGCGAGEAQPIDPSGIDGLQIPTSTPDPADFVAEIDNAWLPLAPGRSWTYDVTADAGNSARAMVSVLVGTRKILGVETTVVRTEREGEVVTEANLAQDRDGNVWQFAGEGWQAGVAGVTPGLVMPARPRVGDGFVASSGETAERSQVDSLDANVVVPYRPLDGVLALTVTQPGNGVAIKRYYARGIGLVLETGTEESLELVSSTN